MSEDYQTPVYYVNQYGERINFSLQGQYSIFRNNIVTPGAVSFNKSEFCKDVLELFVAKKIVSLGLVVAEADKYKLDLFFNNVNTRVQLSIKEAIGFGLDEQRHSFTPFQLRGIKNETTLEQIQNFLLKHSCFSPDNPIKTLQFTSRLDSEKGLSKDKYYSKFIIATKLPNNQSFISSIYSNAKYIDFTSLINDFQLLSVGTIISITRLLSLDNIAFLHNKDLSNITAYGVTGSGETPGSLGSTYAKPFILEWVDKNQVWSGVKNFVKKYMRIRSNLETMEVKHVNISKNYPIEVKGKPSPHSKREFASKMRNTPTQAEEAMGNILNSLKLNYHEAFKRQITIAGFIADFYSPSFRLAIEVDGKSHLTKQAKGNDKEKEIAFFRHQIMTIRVTNQEVLTQADKVKSLVTQAIYSWRRTPIGKDPWSLSEQEIQQKITSFREKLIN